MQGSYDELVGDTLAMVNVLRQAFGKAALDELPDARPGDASDCLYFRAFGDIGVTGVSGVTASFASERVASAAAALWGTNSEGPSVTLPHQFRQVIGRFDGHEMSHYETRHRR
jgi:hypothetical protein